ncbi:MAG: 16S rRNA (cytidine(1402)-2'-O)-methyltransferase [Bacteroidia bacterium]
MGKLLLIPTPVGNLEDITLRAIRELQACDLILAEDTRTSGNLLRHLEISRPMRAFHIHNEHKSLESIANQIEELNQVGLVTDAGTPGISDPGYLLVRECIRRGIQVECLPGPVALIPALVVSGFPTDQFCFEGFLPHKKGRQTRLRKLCEEERTIVLYESPHRLLKTLEQAAEVMGAERKAAVVREISKKFEEVQRNTFGGLISHFSKHPPKGEIVLVIEGAGKTRDTQEEPDESPLPREKRKKE